MTKPNLSLKGADGYIVFSDDDTFEGLNDRACVVLVEGDFDSGNDKAVRSLIEAADEARKEMEEEGDAGFMDPMVPVKVSTDDGGGKVRIVSIDFLVKYYLSNRKRGGPIGVPVGSV